MDDQDVITLTLWVIFAVTLGAIVGVALVIFWPWEIPQ